MQSSSSSFWPLCQQLLQGRFVDLTHPFDEKSPHFAQSTLMKIEDVCSIEKNGFSVQRFSFEGQWGTHVDAPAHFIVEGRAVADIPVKEMILPLVVIDIHEKVEKNPDYILMVDDVIHWEDQFGRIPQGAFVALRTDWSKRWPDQQAMYNCSEDGVPHTPGWSLDALSYVFEECMVTAIGHETIDSDPGFRGRSTNWMCQRYVLKQNRYQIELLANLDQCPLKGAIVICSFPKPLRASGFPARLFAICPH